MINEIKQCDRCDLCNNQVPLIQSFKECDVMWVGLSAKLVENIDEAYPLGEDTNTGKIILEIENELNDISFYKTNLVKCVPLDENNKLRYPTALEMKRCIDHLKLEIKIVKPQIVFLLGAKVIEAIEKQLGKKLEKWDEFNYTPTKINNIIYVAIHHPSYMSVYKRKYIEVYRESIVSLINENVINEPAGAYKHRY